MDEKDKNSSQSIDASLASNDREISLANKFGDPGLDEILGGLSSAEAEQPSPEGQVTLVHETTSAQDLMKLELTDPSSITTPIANEVEFQLGPDSQSFSHEHHQDVSEAYEISPVHPEVALPSSFGTMEPDSQMASLHPVMDLEMDESTLADTVFNATKNEVAEKMFQLIVCDHSFQVLTEEILQIFMNAVNATAGSILEVDHNNEEFMFRSTIGGGDSSQLKTFRIPINKGIVGHVAESRQTLLIRDLDDNELQLKAIGLAVGFQAKCCLALPIVVGNQLYGVVEVFNKQALTYFDRKDVQLLESAVKMASKVLEVRFLMAELIKK